MTSLFEPETSRDSTVDLLNRGGRDVALLEFMAVGAQSTEDVAVMPDEASTAEEVLRAAQIRVMLDSAREDAVSETRRVLGEEYEERVRRERRRVEGLLLDFGEQRRIYFTQAEAAVVRLALTVAAKILQREVTVDAMFLAATVRAALSRIQDGSSAILRVRSEEVGLWEQVFSEEGSNKVEVTADRTLRLGDCVLETAIGTVELGVVAQLGEIERGFRELLERTG